MMAQSGVRVRTARTEDSEAIHEINTACWAEYDVPSGLKRLMTHRPKGRFGEIIEENRSRKDRGFLVAVDDTVLGFVCYWTDGRKGELKSVYVSPEHQREGVGGRLVGEMLKRTPRIRRWRVATLFNNAKGRSFYRKLGFRVQKTRRVKFYGTRIHEVVFTATRERLMAAR